MEIPRGRRVEKAKVFKEKDGTILELQEGWWCGANQKSFRGRAMDVSGTTQIILFCTILHIYTSQDPISMKKQSH